MLLAGLVVQGRRREDGAEVCLVVEVSWGVGAQGVKRAMRRAVTAEAARLAQALRVWQVTDGREVSPELEN